MRGGVFLLVYLIYTPSEVKTMARIYKAA